MGANQIRVSANHVRFPAFYPPGKSWVGNPGPIAYEVAPTRGPGTAPELRSHLRDTIAAAARSRFWFRSFRCRPSAFHGLCSQALEASIERLDICPAVQWCPAMSRQESEQCLSVCVVLC